MASSVQREVLLNNEHLSSPSTRADTQILSTISDTLVLVHGTVRTAPTLSHKVVVHQSGGRWFDSQPLQSACWSIPGQDTENQTVASGSSICVSANGYRSLWAIGSLNGSLCHQCVNVCMNGVNAHSVVELHKYVWFTLCKDCLHLLILKEQGPVGKVPFSTNLMV